MLFMTTLLLFFDIALINSIALNNPNKTIPYVRFDFSGQKAFLPMECKCQRIPGLWKLARQ